MRYVIRKAARYVSLYGACRFRRAIGTDSFLPLDFFFSLSSFWFACQWWKRKENKERGKKDRTVWFSVVQRLGYIGVFSSLWLAILLQLLLAPALEKFMLVFQLPCQAKPGRKKKRHDDKHTTECPGSQRDSPTFLLIASRWWLTSVVKFSIPVRNDSNDKTSSL